MSTGCNTSPSVVPWHPSHGVGEPREKRLRRALGASASGVISNATQACYMPGSTRHRPPGQAAGPFGMRPPLPVRFVEWRRIHAQPPFRRRTAFAPGARTRGQNTCANIATAAVYDAAANHRRAPKTPLPSASADSPIHPACSKSWDASSKCNTAGDAGAALPRPCTRGAPSVEKGSSPRAVEVMP